MCAVKRHAPIKPLEPFLFLLVARDTIRSAAPDNLDEERGLTFSQCHVGTVITSLLEDGLMHIQLHMTAQKPLQHVIDNAFRQGVHGLPVSGDKAGMRQTGPALRCETLHASPFARTAISQKDKMLPFRPKKAGDYTLAEIAEYTDPEVHVPWYENEALTRVELGRVVLRKLLSMCRLNMMVALSGAKVPPPPTSEPFGKIRGWQQMEGGVFRDFE